MLNAVSDRVSYSYTWFSFPQNEKREKGRIYQNGLLSLVTRRVLHSNSWHTSSCWSLLQKCRRTLPNKQRNYKKDHVESNIMMLSDYRWHDIPWYLSCIMHYSLLIIYELYLDSIASFSCRSFNRFRIKSSLNKTFIVYQMSRRSTYTFLTFNIFLYLILTL